MNDSNRNSAQRHREPDLAGAEAAGRAQERAEQIARSSASEDSRHQSGHVHRTTALRGPRELSFSQAHRYEEIPGPLKLEELPTDARTRIWNLLFVHLDKSKATDDFFGNSWVGREWKHIWRAAHADFHISPLDEWSSDFWPACKKLREYIEMRPFNKVFDLIQFVLRHPRCPGQFIAKEMKRTFCGMRIGLHHRCGATADHRPGRSRRRKAKTVVEALQTLREHAGLELQRVAFAEGGGMHQHVATGREASGRASMP